ncbi:ParB/RepB/Spo0J family partition protein [Ruficoccus amylovorans]|uniref:ParB/RepB/Spo0J family partition protein n=1 Tax=Ruficoccus amylovorans TaxID=1804625 RepID=A0A842HD98_9BACT|nr:ParB/RepB/Spo0J family partition protein [Ruficoccus amylovorans]MBC2593567.1 ParB/RepB/Spo0J family partition protein [Ruficoccus amylovorans]
MAQAKKRLGRGLGNLIAGGVAKKETPAPAPAPKKAKRGKSAKGSKKEKTSVTPIKRAAPKPAAAAPAPAPVPAPAPAPAAPESPYREIDVSSIDPSPYQPRRQMNAEPVKELAESIRSEGLLQPIVVRQRGQKYELIAGERRWRAHLHLGLKKIAARIMDASDSSSAVISLIENVQREGLNAIEEALAYASLMGDFDLTQEAVAERVGKGRATVANALRLLQLDREIQGYVAKGMLSAGHAKVLLGLEDPAQRLLLARRIIETGMSVREAEKQVQRLKSEPGKSPLTHRNAAGAEDTIVRDLEKQIATRLNTKVHLKHTAKKGRIIIEYYGNEDLQRILEKTGLQ